MATIIIRRKSSMVGCAQNHDVFLLNKFVGNLKNGSILEIPAETGTHILSFNSTMKKLGKNATFTVVINEPDETVELRTRFSASGEYVVEYADNKPHISEIDNTVDVHKEQDSKVENTPALKRQGVSCPRCGSQDIYPVSEVSTKGKDFNASDACCGYLLCGPLGLLCGATGKGKQTTTTTYWMCKGCGNKFKA